MSLAARPEPPVTWLLDVDGVLNAVTSRPDTSVWPADAWVRTEARAAGRAYPILAAQPVLDFVAAVAASGAADVRWHTTWQHDAVASLAPALGLPPLPVEDAPEFQVAGGASGYAGTHTAPAWWKLSAARRAVSSGRPLVWTDDDLARFGVQREIDEQPFEPDTVLLVAPRTDIGLTPAHLRAIDAFLQRQQ